MILVYIMKNCEFYISLLTENSTFKFPLTIRNPLMKNCQDCKSHKNSNWNRVHVSLNIEMTPGFTYWVTSCRSNIEMTPALVGQTLRWPPSLLVKHWDDHWIYLLRHFLLVKHWVGHSYCRSGGFAETGWCHTF
jgi:hypothetical protein